MGKNRIIYQSQSLYAGQSAPSGAYVVETGAAQGGSLKFPRALQRIQNINYSFDIARTDVNQFGELANIDRVILESPTVSLDFSYYFANFANEKAMGFTIDDSISAISGMLNRTSDERNYYIRVVSEGDDSIGISASSTGTGTNDVIGIGNGFLSSYSAEASVGDFPTASVTVEALNIAFDKGVTGNKLPKVNPVNGVREATSEYALPVATGHVIDAQRYSVVRPGDITVSIANGGLGANIADAKIQSYSLSFDLAREPLQKLGNKFAFAREMTFPVTVSLSVDALLGNLDTGDLAAVVSGDATLANIELTLKSGATAHCKYILKGAKLDGQSYSTSIGDNKTVTMNFSSQVGSPQQTTVGLFMSGKGSTA